MAKGNQIRKKYSLRRNMLLLTIILLVSTIVINLGVLICKALEIKF